MISVIEFRPVFRLYSVYTVCLSMLFLALHLLDGTINWWKPIYPKLIPIILTVYVILAVINMLLASSSVVRSPDRLVPNFFGEILILGMMLIIVTPAQKELAQVMLVTVGIANMIVSARLGYLIAAMATIMILTNAVLNQGEITGNLVFESGLLGTLYFSEALLLHAFRRRISSAESTVVDKQKELHKAARLNDMIIERMQTGICVARSSGEVISINRAAKERIGSISIGESLPEVLYERLQHWVNYKKQSDKPILVGVTEVSVIASFAPIDEQTTLVFLEDSGTVAHKAQQFKLASLGRMAASIAHEIRNPLSAIGHASQLLIESEDLIEEDKKLCDIIINHTNRVDLIIQNVLQISRRHPSNSEQIQLLPWLEKFLAEFKENHDIEVSVIGKDLDIEFDKSQLHQVLWNLCENAIRYGSNNKGCRVRIQLSRNPVDRRPRLSFCDFGTGISEEQKPYLFEPFHTTSPQGTGLGLYIIKELCEANQAEIRYYDDPDCGACFQLMFAYSSSYTSAPA